MKLGLCGRGKHADLQGKLIKKMINDRFNQELKRLEEQMKLYIPESDPDSEEIG